MLRKLELSWLFNLAKRKSQAIDNIRYEFFSCERMIRDGHDILLLFYQE